MKVERRVRPVFLCFSSDVTQDAVVSPQQVKQLRLHRALCFDKCCPLAVTVHVLAV